MVTRSTADANRKTARDHESYKRLSVLAIILPLVGLILGIVYLAKDKPADRKLGEHLVAISVIFGIIWAGLWVLLSEQNLFTPAASNPSPAVDAPADAPMDSTPARIGDTLLFGDLSVIVKKVIDPATID